MEWERFVYSGRSFTPKATINKAGNLSFNAAARSKFQLGEYQYAVMFFDQGANRIGVMLTNNEKEQGRKTLRQRPTGADISIRTFLDFYGLNSPEPRGFEVEQDGASGYLVLDLGAATQRRRRRRSTS